MTSLPERPSRLSAIACCLSIAACSQVTEAPRSYLPIANSLLTHAERKSTYRVLHSFAGPPIDGLYPVAGLIDVNGTLYGTTEDGGAYGGKKNSHGTVFSISTAGANERVLHSFGAGSDGINPVASLIDVDGILYGTTGDGGGPNAVGYGTAFSMSTTGSERVLYSFVGSGSNGIWPGGSLLSLKGALYGTTQNGGASKFPGVGVVFVISTAGTNEQLLHSFGKVVDGANPEVNLVAVDQTLYGTTFSGGAHGHGVVFSIAATGEDFRVLHSFGGADDGADPMASLIDVNGTFYGTTSNGGAHKRGTVFSIRATGTERVLYDFHKLPDGANPQASLIYLNGALYGTTSAGGDYDDGLVFSMDTAGKHYRVLHSFAGSPKDGSAPEAALLAVKGKLYGTTSRGGVRDDGTIFALTP